LLQEGVARGSGRPGQLQQIDALQGDAEISFVCRTMCPAPDLNGGRAVVTTFRRAKTPVQAVGTTAGAAKRWK
jgi:hypothetical protein